MYVDIQGKIRQLALQLPHSPPSLIDGFICVSASSGVGVGDRDSSKTFPRPLAWSLATFQHEFVPETAVFVSIPMRPAVHCNRQHVLRGIKAARPKRPSQLLANLALHSFKRRAVELDAAGGVLFSRRAARATRRLAH